MVTFFQNPQGVVYAVESVTELTANQSQKLSWMFSGANYVDAHEIPGQFIGPRREMITPWSTNAVEITQNMGLSGIERIEMFQPVNAGAEVVCDKMLQRNYNGLDQEIFNIAKEPDPVREITDLKAYNDEQGLALSPEEVAYLEKLSQRLQRPLTDSEVFGFSQVNSEHCRHKIFNGKFVIDGVEMPQSLFQLIKSTSKHNPNGLVSAYKDNVAFVKGPVIQQFYPETPDHAGKFVVQEVGTVLSLKAETHNFPTTVEPFNGAATGTGGEIRDRLGGGRASVPLAGTAVYMTSYPRLDPDKRWEMMMNPRLWLYQTPAELLIKASNGASDFGNKFGQPLICGSLLTFEHDEHGIKRAYDKVIMLAGGVGYAQSRDAIKGIPEKGQAVVVMGGDNYRIGMGGGAVSSVETGRYNSGIELNAVQRANPEMQKRVANVIRALAENPDNPIVSIHDHGAGGHLNALSELVEETGGHIDLDTLPVGDKSLSAMEIVGNESQERMGMVLNKEDVDYVQRIAQRERAPMYVVGETTGDHRFVFERNDGTKPIDLDMADMFGSSPKTTMVDRTVRHTYADPKYYPTEIDTYIRDVLSLEAVACKDWLTNKVDRSVTGRVARQQCIGEFQLPLSDCGVVSLDYTGHSGIATSLGHAPQAALVDSAKGAVLSIAEAITNIVGAPLKNGLKSISLSANWMWPCKNEGEDAALYRAVEGCSKFATAIGVNIPTGKDSLSMTQKYSDGTKILAPGTVIISAAGETTDVRDVVTSAMKTTGEARFYHIDFSGDSLKLGGSALFQTFGAIGEEVPTVMDNDRFVGSFNIIQSLIKQGLIAACHDISAGGMITTLLEMTFPNRQGGISIRTDNFRGESDLVKILFSENPGIIIQVSPGNVRNVERVLAQEHIGFTSLGGTTGDRKVTVNHGTRSYVFDIEALRDIWYHTSYLMDTLQSGPTCAELRFKNYKQQPVRFRIPHNYKGKLADRGLQLRHSRRTTQRVQAAIIREKGVNGDREMAYSLYLAGFDVKDVHMTDLMSGAETLQDVNMLVFCGGFSHSDVLGSAKGWASGFKFNANASKALKDFYNRDDTMSLGVCNGCQLMMELGLIKSAKEAGVKMAPNVSHKFESAFLSVQVGESPCIMFKSLEGSCLGIWIAHGEGRFDFPGSATGLNVALRYLYPRYPGNPNGSKSRVAGICSDDGRHLAMMPHLERSIFPWQCAFYPANRKDEVTPWIDAFVNARKWIEKKIKKSKK